MKAIELSEYCGIDCLKIIDVEKPRPGANEILLKVRAAGINFAEMELTKGKYKIPKNPPFIMGFEASGVVAEVGSQVKNPQVGDKITAIVSSGGYAEYATADANLAIPVPCSALLCRSDHNPYSRDFGLHSPEIRGQASTK